MKFEEIVTERLILKKFTQESFDFIYSKMSQNQQLNVLALNSVRELLIERQKYKKGLSTYNRKFLYFQLIEKNTTKIIGWCGFHTWYTAHNRAEIGYELFDDKDKGKGKGFMSEAIIPIVKYGFESVNLERIEAFVGKKNTNSLKLLKRMKFQKEGLFKHHYFRNNKMEDSIAYALLKSEYKKTNTKNLLTNNL